MLEESTLLRVKDGGGTRVWTMVGLVVMELLRRDVRSVKGANQDCDFVNGREKKKFMECRVD